MKTPPEIRERLVDRAPGGSGVEDHAAWLAGNAAPLADPDPRALARVAARLSSRSRPAAPLRLRPAIVVAAMLLAAAGGALAARGLGGAGRPTRPRLLSVPAGSIVRIQEVGGRRIAIFGPAEVRLDDGPEAPLAVSLGHLRVEDAAAAPLAMTAARARIVLPPGGGADVLVGLEGAVKVENVTGSIRVLPSSGADAVDVSPGQSWSSFDSHSEVTTAASANDVAQPSKAVASAGEPIEEPRHLPNRRTASDHRGGERPAQVSAPGATPADAAEAPLAAESRLLREAVVSLRGGRARAALEQLDNYKTRFPRGTLAPEAFVLRVEALVDLGRRREALATLNRHAIAGDADARKLWVVRGELRAAAGDCDGALEDFEAALRNRIEDRLSVRARAGQAACR